VTSFVGTAARGEQVAIPDPIGEPLGVQEGLPVNVASTKTTVETQAQGAANMSIILHSPAAQYRGKRKTAMSKPTKAKVAVEKVFTEVPT
jgi:hypothetical protein